MANFTPDQKQQRLMASYFSDKPLTQEVVSQLLVECKNDDAFLTYLSELQLNDRLLAAELEELNNKQLFVDEVVDRIAHQQTNSIEPEIMHDIHGANQTHKAYQDSKSRYLALVASVLFVAVLLFIHNGVSLIKFAEVTKVAANEQDEFRLGQAFGKQKIELQQGYSELTLSNGVVLVLEAPVSLDLISQDYVLLNQGKLVARVPENAIGFKIDTPSSEIIDLGTEFGVQVNRAGESQVHVIDGEVKARPNKKQPFTHLIKDQAMAFNRQNLVTRMPSNSSEFMRVLPGQSIHDLEYLHWSFDQAEDGVFHSQGHGFGDFSAIDQSTPHRLRQVPGVYGQALNFDGQRNWLKTDFPGIGSDDPRTVAFWVKVPSDFSTDHAYGILSWGLQDFYKSWQISPNPEPTSGPLGRIRIGTYNAQVVGSTDLRDDTWHHIAVVLYGGENSDISTHVLLYVDGKLEKTFKKSIAKVATELNHPNSKPLSLGRNIGFDGHAKHETQKYFKGQVDELFVFAAALDQVQIQQLMLHNRLKLPVQ